MTLTPRLITACTRPPTRGPSSTLAAVQTIRQKLPFLVDLTPEERHKLPKMGDTGRAFVERALTVAAQNPDILPRSFDAEEFRRDAELLASLQPVAAALGQLYELVDDTMLEVSGEAYASALAVYSYARAGRARRSTACSKAWRRASRVRRARTRLRRRNRRAPRPAPRRGRPPLRGEPSLHPGDRRIVGRLAGGRFSVGGLVPAPAARVVGYPFP